MTRFSWFLVACAAVCFGWNAWLFVGNVLAHRPIWACLDAAGVALSARTGWLFFRTERRS